MTSSLWEVEQSRRLPDKSHSEMVSQWIPLDSSLDQASCLSYDVRQLWTTAGLFLGCSEFCLNSTNVHTATLVAVSPCQLLLCSRLAKTRRPFSHMPHRHHSPPSLLLQLTIWIQVWTQSLFLLISISLSFNLHFLSLETVKNFNSLTTTEFSA